MNSMHNRIMERGVLIFKVVCYPMNIKLAALLRHLERSIFRSNQYRLLAISYKTSIYISTKRTRTLGKNIVIDAIWNVPVFTLAV